jgi:hypothetical protein
MVASGVSEHKGLQRLVGRASQETLWESDIGAKRQTKAAFRTDGRRRRPITPPAPITRMQGKLAA